MTSLRGKERQEFPLKVRKEAFRRSCGKVGEPHCEAPGCGKFIAAGHLIYEHLDPDGLGGKPTAKNCGVWCDVCADKKTFTEDNPRMQKADAVLKHTYGLEPAKQKIASRGFAKRPPQRTASRPIVRHAAGD